MNVVILNWRDIKNPQSGGAEILTHEIAKYLVAKKNNVTIFSSVFPGSKKTEILDGVKIIRDGKPDLRSGINSVHYKAYAYYKKHKFGVIDILIDEVHGVPFFSPLYVREKKFAFICEKAGNLWDIVLPFPLNYLGRLTEKIYPIFYKNLNIITISTSSKDELSTMFSKKNIKIVHPGSSSKILNTIPQKDTILNLVFIARLSKTKGLEDALTAVSIIKDKKMKVVLHVIGRGEENYVRRIKEKISSLGLLENVILYGYVSESEKNKIIDKSHMLICPSQKEGWGLTVHEVGARGVPVIAYKVPGLSEVVVNDVNGRLVSKNTAYDLAMACINVFNNKRDFLRLQKGAISERKKFTWNKTGEDFLKIIHEE